MRLPINLLTSFTAGILIATTITGAVYFSDNSEKATAKTSSSQAAEKVQLSEKEMKEKLEAAGFVVQTKDEYDKNQKGAKESGKEQTASEEDKKPVTQVIVNVADGMTSIDVGNQLAQAQLIPDAFQFSKDVEARGLQNKLRPGTYNVDSGMSYDQLITAIFH